MKKRANVIGKPPKPAKTKVQILGRKEGQEEKHIAVYTIYADPEKVAAAVESALRTRFR